MPIHPFEKGNEQWLVSGYSPDSRTSSQVLIKVIESLHSRPDVKILNIIGTEKLPRQLVFSATASTITALQAAFGDRIIIAPDKPLQLFNGFSGDSNFSEILHRGQKNDY
ncbi:hypothetical protein [Priestia megaterium]|uniref:hypothetical protein n=1 Tax=Priestia megaterium TaxID=1404 RepID=UPI0031FCF699